MKIYILGAGSMGGAIISGLVKKNDVSRENIFVLSGHRESTKKIADKYRVNAVKELREFKEADLVINATPVAVSRRALPELAKVIKSTAVVVSVAYGIGVMELGQLLRRETNFVYMIPNIPVAVNQGILAVSTPVDYDFTQSFVYPIIEGLGKVIEVPEDLMNTVSAGAGSSPAFAAIFIEALADGMVLHGLKRDQAYGIAEQMLKGTASLLAEGNILPAQLKDLVASPGGSTIKGVAALENSAFRAAVINAITKTVE